MLGVAVPDTWVYHSLDGMRGKKSIRRCLMPGMVPEFILVLYILVNKSVLGNNNAQYWLYRWGRDGGYGYIKGFGPLPTVYGPSKNRWAFWIPDPGTLLICADRVP